MGRMDGLEWNKIGLDSIELGWNGSDPIHSTIILGYKDHIS